MTPEVIQPKLTREEAVQIVVGHLEGKLRGVVPREGHLNFQSTKTVEKRVDVYREIAIEADKLDLPDASLDKLLARILDFEMIKRDRTLEIRFFREHDLPNLLREFGFEEEPDALNEAMALFPRAENIAKNPCDGWLKFYRENGGFGSRGMIPIQFSSLLLARELELPSEEQAIRGEYFIYDYLLHGPNIIDFFIYGREVEKEIEQFVQIVAKEWEISHDKVREIIQVVIGDLAERKCAFYSPYDLLKLNNVHERASALLGENKGESEIDWSDFGAAKLAGAFIRTTISIGGDLDRINQSSVVDVVRRYARPIYDAKVREKGEDGWLELDGMTKEKLFELMTGYYLEVAKKFVELSNIDVAEFVRVIVASVGISRNNLLLGWQVIEEFTSGTDNELFLKRELLDRVTRGSVIGKFSKEQRLEIREMASQCDFGDLVERIDQDLHREAMALEESSGRDRLALELVEQQREKQKREAKLKLAAARVILQKK